MKVLVAGDFCPKDRVETAFEKKDYSSVFGEVRNLTAEVDYSIVNFECPVVTGSAKPIGKVGPNLQCSPNGMEALKYAGFNCVTLANNHFYDYGDEGVISTIKTGDYFGLDHVGGGENIKEASKTLYKTIGSQVLAVINCCEHEFSIATKTSGGSNPLNPIQQYHAIDEARKMADYVLVIVHGGNEHYQLPSPRMKEIYQFFVEAGADAVINHHQHCFSGYEVYKGKPIFYGLGNFCFDNPNYRSSMWNMGYMVCVDFSNEKIGFDIFPYNQCSDNDRLEMLDKYQAESFFNDIQTLNSIIQDEEMLEKKYDDYLITQSDLKWVFAPYSNRITLSLCNRGLLPSFLSKKKRMTMLAYIQCESHIPKVIHYLLNNK